MNPEIGKLFNEIDELEKVVGFLRDYSMVIRIKDLKLKIKSISLSLNPQIPEKYAKMSAVELLEGLGQYDVGNR